MQDRMRDNQTFGLKTALAAMISSGCAFALLSWQPPWLVAYLACCVAALWLLLFAGCLVPGRSTSRELLRVLVWGGLTLTTALIAAWLLGLP